MGLFSFKLIHLSLGDRELWRVALFAVFALSIAIAAVRDRPFYRAPKVLLWAALAGGIATSALSHDARGWTSVASSAFAAGLGGALIWLDLKLRRWTNRDRFITLMNSPRADLEKRVGIQLAMLWAFAILGAFLGLKGAVWTYFLVGVAVQVYAFFRTLTNDMELSGVRVPFAALILLAGPAVMLARRVIEWTPFR